MVGEEKRYGAVSPPPLENRQKLQMKDGLAGVQSLEYRHSGQRLIQPLGCTRAQASVDYERMAGRRVFRLPWRMQENSFSGDPLLRTVRGSVQSSAFS